jgi:hypothetical protein
MPMNRAADSTARPLLSRRAPPQIETKFLRLSQPVPVGHWIDDWRVIWVGGWDRGRIFFVVMVERSTQTRTAAGL